MFLFCCLRQDHFQRKPDMTSREERLTESLERWSLIQTCVIECKAIRIRHNEILNCSKKNSWPNINSSFVPKSSETEMKASSTSLPPARSSKIANSDDYATLILTQTLLMTENLIASKSIASTPKSVTSFLLQMNLKLFLLRLTLILWFVWYINHPTPQTKIIHQCCVLPYFPG